MVKRLHGAMLSSGLLVLAAIVVAGIAAWQLVCPCERIPGGYLLGSEIKTPVVDWSFANDVPLCQIQVNAGLLPHSVNLNCMASRGELYLSCSACDGKRWSAAVLTRPEARLRVGDAVYPVRVSRLRDPDILDRAWKARAIKLGRPQDDPRPDHWWSFRVESRQGSSG